MERGDACSIKKRKTLWYGGVVWGMASGVFRRLGAEDRGLGMARPLAPRRGGQGWGRNN